jgi:hypothetical protein
VAESKPLTAKQQEEQDAYVQSLVDAAPPLTPAQQLLVLQLFTARRP